MTIAFLQRKGGCGKTTNAVNVAKELRRRGKRVVLIETDRNYTPSAIKATETYIAPQTMIVKHVTGKQLTREGIREYVRQVKTKEQPDYIVIDGAAEMSAALLSAIAAMSDVMILTTNLDTLEIEGTKLTLIDLAEGIKENPALKIALLPNRIHWRMLQSSVQDALAELHTPVLPAMPLFKEYRIETHKNPGGLYRGLVKHILAMMDDKRFTAVTFTPELNETTSTKRHVLKCGFSKCTKGNNPGWFFSERSDAEYCCDSHRVMGGREKLRSSAPATR